jgi:hypothetical protein
MKNDIHTTLLEIYFFGYIDRAIDVEEMPLFTRAYEEEPLSTVIAREFQLSHSRRKWLLKRHGRRWRCEK